MTGRHVLTDQAQTPTQEPNQRQPKIKEASRKDLPPKPEVIQRLLAEHEYAGRLLKVLDDQVQAIKEGKAPDYQALHAVMHYMTNYPDRYHHPKEDLMFDRLLERDPEMRSRIEVLVDAHRAIGQLGRELLDSIALRLQGGAAANDNELAQRAGRYAAALGEHMGIEEREVFARACEVLREEDWTAIEDAIEPVTDPIFGEAVMEAYNPLVRYLIAQPAFRRITRAIDQAGEAGSRFRSALGEDHGVSTGMERISAVLMSHALRAYYDDLECWMSLVGSRDPITAYAAVARWTESRRSQLTEAVRDCGALFKAGVTRSAPAGNHAGGSADAVDGGKAGYWR